MKTLVKSVFAILTFFTVASCSKEMSTETGAEVITGNNFTATINGGSWKADSLEQVIVSDSLVTITGLGKNNQEISIVLPTFVVGKYSMNASTAAYALYTQLSPSSTDVYLTNSSIEVAKASGTVEITAIDTLNKTVTGTFSFTGYRASDQTTVSVTTGVFNALAYSRTGSGNGTGTDSTIVDNGRDSLSVFVDGKFFVSSPAPTATYSTDFTPPEVFIAGSSADGQQNLTLNLPADITPGTHSMNILTFTISATFTDNSTIYAPLTTGSVNIFSNDQTNKRITGQFSFTGDEAVGGTGAPKEFTKGYFAISYP